MVCNVLVPQALWFKRIRTNPAILFVIALLVNVGMWTERYVIVVTSLHRDFMPSAWGMFHGTRWDWMTLIGSFGLFSRCSFYFSAYCLRFRSAKCASSFLKKRRKQNERATLRIARGVRNAGSVAPRGAEGICQRAIGKWML